MVDLAILIGLMREMKKPRPVGNALFDPGQPPNQTAWQFSLFFIEAPEKAKGAA